MTFFKSLLSSILGTIIGLCFFVFLFFLFIIGIVAVFKPDEDQKIEVKNNSVLLFDMSGTISEKTEDSPDIISLLNEDFDNKGYALKDILISLKEAKTDPKIKGIYLQSHNLLTGFASAKEVRDALVDFKTSGKFIYGYGEVISKLDYYILSTADTIYVTPEGMVELGSFRSSSLFFKGAFDKLEIEPLIFKVGDFKSYGEQFTRKEFSNENKIQINDLIQSLYTTMIQEEASSRNISETSLRNIFNNDFILSAKNAVKKGIITNTGYEDEIELFLKKRSSLTEKGKIQFISLKKYIKAVKKTHYSKNQIAVIIAEGTIMPGKSTDEVIGSESLAQEIKKARENTKIKAVVIRINSPGGSAMASDIIWREIMLTKKIKPCIASMSDVAASGGYYIAMPCDTIVAQKNTITGSIGVVGILFDFHRFLENKLGITYDEISTGKKSSLIGAGFASTPTDLEKATIQNMINDTYESFTTKASESRRIPLENLKKIAGGRVWIGDSAQKIGLVDVIGNLETAIQIASHKAHLDSGYHVVYFPKPKPFAEQIMEKISNTTEEIYLSNKYGILYPYKKELQKLNQYKGINMYIPYNIEFQ
ncbi:MAG: signal peptide peptidase SppA [Chitinophagaceae bacterium]|nr:signal peptide peptidase SppA [Chitinophagaceae bacterium]